MRNLISAVWLAALATAAFAQEPRWIYGRHAELGQSAHIVLPGGAYVGIVCTGQSEGAIVRMVFSASFFPTEYQRRNATQPLPNMARFTVSYAYDGLTEHGGEILSRAPRGNYQRAGNSCDVNIDALRRARAMWFFDQADFDEASRAEAGTADPPADIAERIARRAPVRMRLPLNGAPQAIEQLVAACPALAEDIRNNCGI